MNKFLSFLPDSIKSRKFVLTVVAAIIVILFPDAANEVIAVLGVYVGGNVAQKFSAAHTAGIAALEAGKELASEATNAGK